MSGKELWDLFSRQFHVAQSSFDAWAFGAEPDLLAHLVLSGEKTATASAHPLYALEDEPIPEVGEYSVILDSREEALCVIRTTKVTLIPFCDVPASHAYKEGEGDKSLAYWRRIHAAFFTQCMAEAGLEFTPEMIVVCEEFEVVFHTCFASEAKEES